MRRLLPALLSLAPVLLATSVGAQVRAPTREEIERAPAPAPPTAGPRVAVEGNVERAPCPLADPAYRDIQVTLTRAQFGGLEPIPASALESSWRPFVGRPMPVAAVCEIRDRAATILRAQGYLAAVQVPPQRIEGGIVKFDVLLARLTGFQVRGTSGRGEAILARYLRALQDQPVFNLKFAERYLLLARDLPGYDVRLTLRPAGTAPGEVTGEVLVNRTPVEVDVAVQNYGSREVGRYGGLVQARFNGVFGVGDRTTLGLFTTHDFREQQVVQGVEEMRVGREGLTLGADIAYAWTRPTLGGGLIIRSQTLIASMHARYPLVRRQSHNLFVGAGFDLIDQRTRLSGIALSTDRLRVPWARFDYDAIDLASIVSTQGYSPNEPRWRVGLGGELRHGIGVLGASPACGPGAIACTGPGVVPPSRLVANPTALVARVNAFAEFRPVPHVMLSVAARGQYSPGTLLSYEQFSGGNYTIGRGYDPGTVTGDSGLGLRGEVGIGGLVPTARDRFAVQGYGFVDAAWVWNHEFVPGRRDPQRLESVGGGVRVAWGDRAILDVGVAVPLRAAELLTQRPDTRVLVSLTTRLLPWLRR